MHVLETWFAALILHNKSFATQPSGLLGSTAGDRDPGGSGVPGANTNARATFFADDAGADEDEIAVITADVESALQQMRTMVDDVLDLRQVRPLLFSY